MEFMFFSKYISCDSAADLFLMKLINKTEFNKHHKVIYHMFNVLGIQNINKYCKQLQITATCMLYILHQSFLRQDKTASHKLNFIILQHFLTDNSNYYNNYSFTHVKLNTHIQYQPIIFCLYTLERCVPAFCYCRIFYLLRMSHNLSIKQGSFTMNLSAQQL